MIAIDIAWLPLSRGLWTKVNQADLALLLEYVWHAIPCGKNKMRVRGYRKGGPSHKRVYMHTAKYAKCFSTYDEAVAYRKWLEETYW